MHRLDVAFNELKLFRDKLSKDKLETVYYDQEYIQDIQIDWITAKVPFFYKGKLNGGNIINTTRDGEVEYMIEKRLSVRGSFESNMTVRTSLVTPVEKDTWIVEISGNPIKWFQGHNIFGSSDLVNVVYETVQRLSELLEAPQPQEFLDDVVAGNFTLSRVDLTAMYAMPTRSDVYAWLKHAEKTARTRTGTSVTKGNTVYLNKSSERWNVVCYSKGLEIEKHKLPLELKQTGLIEYADNKLRVELRLRSKELTKIGLNVGSGWLGLNSFNIYRDYVGRIQMTEQDIRQEDLLNIPKCARLSYELWSVGKDIRQFVSRRKFYKDRKILLEFGVDISVPKPVETNSNVIPFRRFLDMKPAGTPEWAIGTNLYFEPRKYAK